MDWSAWPAVSGTDWSWGWRAYPGVWLVVAALGAGYLVRTRTARRDRRPSARQLALFVAGWLTLWIAIDWPVGALAQHLLSVRTMQYLVITMAVAPLLLLGVPRLALDGTLRGRLLRWLTHPRVTVPLFGVTLLVTHLPRVVDAAAPNMAGQFGIIVAWFVSGLLFWWRVAGPEPEVRRLPYLAGVVYLFLPFLFPKVPGIIFTFHNESLYEVYRSAPTLFGLSHTTDQQIAGFLLWFVGSAMVIAALGVLFFRWYGEDRRMSVADNLELPADPRAVDLLFEVPGAWSALEQLVRIVSSALPPQHHGAELTFSYREPVGAARPQVVLELHVALEPAAERALAERIEREYGVVLRRLARWQRAPVAERLSFRLVTYGTRVR